MVAQRHPGPEASRRRAGGDAYRPSLSTAQVRLALDVPHVREETDRHLGGGGKHPEEDRGKEEQPQGKFEHRPPLGLTLPESRALRGVA